MSEWRWMFWTGVSAVIAALVLTFASTLGSLATQAANVENQESNSIAIMQQYREFNQYDNTVLLPQDVISAIANFGGFPVIWVDTVPGPGVNFGWQWGPSTPASQFSPTYLASIFPVTGTYTSTLVKDANGEIVRIEFRRN